jgi:multidrug resistance efflux pump
MHEVIQKLHDVLDLGHKKIAELDKRERALNDTEAKLKNWEVALEEKENDLAQREATIQPIENVNEANKQLVIDRQKLSDDKQLFDEVTTKFNRWKVEQTATITSDRNANKLEAERLAKVNDELEAAKETYKKEVLAELAKK